MLPVLGTISSQTTAFVSAVVVGLIGLGNLGYSFFNGRSDRRHQVAQADANREQALTQATADREQALTLAREEREHQIAVLSRQEQNRLQILREERLFDQRRDTYLDTLTSLSAMHEWAANTYPVWSAVGQEQRPRFEATTAVGPRAALFASPGVWRSVQHFREEWAKANAIAQEIDAYIAQRKPDDLMKARQRLDQVRERLTDQLLALAEDMRDELRAGPE